MAFGPSRHRAWVVGQGSPGCFLGSLRSAFGGLLGAVWRPWGSFRGLLGSLLGPLETCGVSWGPLGGRGLETRGT
eukprot:5454737-Pyramimonas_sp.AAC.1